MAQSSDATLRRRPEQARSRARVQAILDATATLITDRGIDQVTMTDIAKKSDMSLAALYRYFPKKTAIIREIVLRVFRSNDETLVREIVEHNLSGAELIRLGVNQYWAQYRAEPFRIHLRAAILADAELSRLNLEDSRANAAVLAQHLAHLSGRTDHETIERQTLFFVEMIDDLMRLVSQVSEEEGEAFIEDFICLAIATLT